MKLLPLLCLLSAGFGPASAGETCNSAESDVTVAEGEDVLLPCAPVPEYNIVKFEWQKDKYKYKDKKEVFFYDKDSYKPNTPVPYQDDQFKGRVEFFKDELDSGNASIKIRNTSWKDSGTYTCGVFKDNNWIILNIRLNVGTAPKPDIDVQDNDTWSLLECKAEGVPEPELEWRNSAGVTLNRTEKHAPKNQNGPVHVKLRLNVTRSDTYTCVVKQESICHQINRTTKVSIPEREGSATDLVALGGWIVAVILGLIVIAALVKRCLSKKKKTGRASDNEIMSLNSTTNSGRI